MTTPSIGGKPTEIIHPNGYTVLYLNPYSGTYSASRSYALRMQRGYRRGLSQTESRGHVRSERPRPAPYGPGETRWSRFTGNFERRWDVSYNYWRYLRRHGVDEINRLTSKDGFGYITIESVSQVVQAWKAGWRDPNFPEFDTWQQWIEFALTERLENMLEYQENANVIPGRTRWNNRSSVPPIEFYYYH